MLRCAQGDSADILLPSHRDADALLRVDKVVRILGVLAKVGPNREGARYWISSMSGRRQLLSKYGSIGAFHWTYKGPHARS